MTVTPFSLAPDPDDEAGRDLLALMGEAERVLTDRELAALFRLLNYQRTSTRALPPREANLAKIAGVSLQSWRHIRAAVADFLGPVALAGASPDAPDDPTAGKDPRKVEAGRIGAIRRWNERRAANGSHPSATVSAMAPIAPSIAEPIAPPMAEAMADSYPPSHGEPRAPGMNEWGLSPDSSIETHSFTPSEATTRDGTTSSTGDGKNGGSTGSKADGEIDSRDTGPTALLTIVAATGTGGVGEGPPVAAPTDAEIEAVIREAAQKNGKPFLSGDWNRPALLQTVRSWVVVEGFSLHDHYKPAVAVFASKATKPVDHPANKAIRRIMENKRGEKTPVVPPGCVEVFEGTEGGNAWIERLGRRDIFPYERDGRRYGFYTERPPPLKQKFGVRG